MVSVSAPFSSCSLVCLCCMSVDSRSVSLCPCVSLPLWSCVSLSLNSFSFSLLCCLLPPTPHWDSVSMKEKPEPLGYLKLEEEASFPGAVAKLRDPEHLPCQPILQYPWPRKGEVKGSKP